MFLKTLYVLFKGKSTLSKMEYSDSVERTSEEIINYLKSSYPKGAVLNVFVVEK